MVDEVESLAAARKNGLSGSEPSDSIRVVNALLTQLDSLKDEENVVILTTSNITQAIDIAFVDRADIKQYIGNPGEKARYQILLSCIKELQRCKIIKNDKIHSNCTKITNKENCNSNDNNNTDNNKTGNQEKNNNNNRKFGDGLKLKLQSASNQDNGQCETIKIPQYQQLMTMQERNADKYQRIENVNVSNGNEYQRTDYCYGVQLNTISKNLKVE